MTKPNITMSAIGIATTAIIIFSALPVMAQTVTTTTKAQAASAARLSGIITKADSDISARITALNDLNTRVQSLKNVSTDKKLQSRHRYRQTSPASRHYRVKFMPTPPRRLHELMQGQIFNIPDLCTRHTAGVDTHVPIE